MTSICFATDNNDNDDSGPLCITSTTQLQAPDGTGNERTTVGIGEEIDLEAKGKWIFFEEKDAKSVEWEIVGDGTDYAELKNATPVNNAKRILKIKMPDEQQTELRTCTRSSLFQIFTPADVVPLPFSSRIFNLKKVKIKVTGTQIEVAGNTAEIEFTIYTPDTLHMIGKIPPVGQNGIFGNIPNYRLTDVTVNAVILLFPEPLFVNFGGGTTSFLELAREGGCMIKHESHGKLPPRPPKHTPTKEFIGVRQNGSLDGQDNIRINGRHEQKCYWLCGFAWHNKSGVPDINDSPRWLGEMSDTKQVFIIKGRLTNLANGWYPDTVPGAATTGTKWYNAGTYRTGEASIDKIGISIFSNSYPFYENWRDTFPKPITGIAR